MLLSKALKGITRTVSDTGTTTQNSSAGDFSRGYQNGRGGRRGRGQSRRGWRGIRNTYTPRSRFEDADGDDDVAMAGDEERPQRRYNPYQHKRGGYDRRSGGDYKNSRGIGGQDGSSGFTWFKISIPQGTKHDKSWLLNRLQRHIDMAFQPVNYHMKGDRVMFFTEDSKLAESLRKANNAITIKDGTKISISVRPCPPPMGVVSSQVTFGSESPPFDDKTQQIFMESLSLRYNINTHNLNLSDYFHDEVLNKNGLKGILAKHWVMETVLKIIQENCPEIQTLDLSENRIQNLDGLRELGTKAPHVIQLKLCNNLLRNVSELEKLKSLKNLVSLDLNGNPLCDNYQDQEKSVYISNVRNFLPKIEVLDGQQLPPPIAFDLPSDVSLPKPLGSYLGEPQIKELILKFLQQYFMVYDSDDRQKLLEAYHDYAIFSLSANPDSVFKDETLAVKNPSLAEYITFSRNLKKVTDMSQRFSLLKHSRLSVVAFLNELPLTKHDLDSFIVDASLVLPTCLSFSVRGQFTEGEKKTLRAFTRIFVVIPAAGGQSLMIVNDQLHIRNPTQAQHKDFKSHLSSSSLAANNTDTSQPLKSIPPGRGQILSVGQPTLSLPSQQQELVQKFSQQSGMNSEFSLKCLVENGWNYDTAAQVFLALQGKGTIPPEAFKK